MSRPFRDKNKDLVNLRVATADEVWVTDNKGKPRLRRDLSIYGRVDKQCELLLCKELCGRAAVFHRKL